jgi:single-strand DNA-binding protein
MARSSPDPAAPLNEVRLRGRISALEETTMPSGDPVVRFRVVVARTEPRRTGGALVDALDCSALPAAARRVLVRAGVDAVVEVSGVLQRRWSRAGGSRVVVEVRTASRVAAAGSRRRATMAG